MNVLFKKSVLKTVIVFLIGSFCMIQPSTSYASKHDQVVISESEHVTTHDKGSRKLYKTTRKNKNQSKTYYVYESAHQTTTAHGFEEPKPSKNRYRKTRQPKSCQSFDYSGAGGENNSISICEMYE